MSTTSASAVPGPSSVSASRTSVQISSVTPPTTSAASQQTQASSQTSVSASVSASAPASTSLSSASQVTPAPISTSQLLLSTTTHSSSQPSLVGNGVSGADADQPISPMKIIIPVVSAVAGTFVILLVSYFYRRYRRRRQLVEAPLPAKRTPVILERRQAQSMYRFETPNNHEYDSLMAPMITSPPDYLGSKSYLAFPSKSTNTFDGAYTHPSLTPSASASMTPFASASASVVSLEKQPSTVSSPPHEHFKGTSAGEYRSPSPQQPFAPPHARRDLRPVALHSRAVSMISVASRNSTYSIAAMRSRQYPGSGGTLRGAPHKNNMNIILPQPLGPSSLSNPTYHMQDGKSPPTHLQHMGPKGGVSPPVQGLWNENEEIQRRSNAYRDSMHEGKCTNAVKSLRPHLKIWYIFSVEREDGNLGNSQGPSVIMPHRGMSHAQTASAPFDWRHRSSPQPDHDVPPVPPLPPLFQMPRVDIHVSRPSSQTGSVFLTPASSLRQSQRPSPPRSPLSGQVSMAEVTPELGIEVLPVAERGQLERIPQLEGPIQQTRLLPDSVFTDPDGELESPAVGSRRGSLLFTPGHPQ